MYGKKKDIENTYMYPTSLLVNRFAAKLFPPASYGGV